MDRNQAELSKSIKELQLINSELKNDIKLLMLHMQIVSKELADISQLRYLISTQDKK